MKAILVKKSRLGDKELLYSLRIKRHWYSSYVYERGFTGNTVEEVVKQAREYLDNMNNNQYPDTIPL